MAWSECGPSLKLAAHLPQTYICLAAEANTRTPPGMQQLADQIIRHTEEKITHPISQMTCILIILDRFGTHQRRMCGLLFSMNTSSLHQSMSGLI